MNTIAKGPKQKTYTWTGKLKNLTGTNLIPSRTAFIGNCGIETDRLFLINYDCITVAENPDQTWSCGSCEVKVVRFVDVSISVVERDDR